MTTALETSIDSSRLVFVAGLHRSGTTPLARLLAAHPEISGFDEHRGQGGRGPAPAGRLPVGAAVRRGRPLRLRPALPPDRELPAGDARRTHQRLLDQWAPHWDLDRRLLLEKSPPNLVMTRFLQALYPEARFVVVVRHPVVVALSTQKWAGPLAGLAPLLEHWVRAHETFLADVAEAAQRPRRPVRAARQRPDEHARRRGGVPGPGASRSPPTRSTAAAATATAPPGQSCTGRSHPSRGSGWPGCGRASRTGSRRSATTSTTSARSGEFPARLRFRRATPSTAPSSACCTSAACRAAARR